MTTTTAFVAGVVTTPAAVAAGIVAIRLARVPVEWVREHRKANIYLRGDLARAYTAAAIMYAPRVAAITLPGGIALAWRSKVPWRNDVRKVAFRIHDLAIGEDVR